MFGVIELYMAFPLVPPAPIAPVLPIPPEEGVVPGADCGGAAIFANAFMNAELPKFI